MADQRAMVFPEPTATESLEKSFGNLRVGDTIAGGHNADAGIEGHDVFEAAEEDFEQAGEEGLSDAPGKGTTTTGGYRFDTPEHKEQLRMQRQQLWVWLKGVGRNMMREGVNLTKITLPVCLFEPRSFLQRMTANWDYMSLLQAAAAAKSPVDRMRYTVAFAISGLCRQVSFHKPFNPILGETLQAVYPSGVRVFAEQISHHPPVSSWQVEEPDEKFLFYGSGNWSAGIKGNSVKGRQVGLNAVKFSSDNATIEYGLPGLAVKGVLWGERVLKYSGEMTFKDAKHGLICVVHIDPQPKQSYISSWFRSKASAGYTPDQVVGTLTQDGKVLDALSGNWLSYLEWQHGGPGGKAKRFWDIHNGPIATPQPVADALPSDSQFRQDLVHLKSGNQPVAQEWKTKLEESQRNDRKLRKEGGGFVER